MQDRLTRDPITRDEMQDQMIEAGPTRLVLRPGWGGRVAGLSHAGREVLCPLQGQGAFVPLPRPLGGAYPLFPFHNRVPGGRFTYRGRAVRLPLSASEPNALHGDAYLQPWDPVEAGADRATMVCRSPAGDWPWAWEARQDFAVAPGRVEIGLSLTNRDETPMPVGLGWHPFFRKATAIGIDAARHWTLDDGGIPTGAFTSRPAPGDPSNRYLSDWSRADLTLDTGAMVRMTASPELGHIVLHDPPKGYSCVEPVSHLAAAMALEGPLRPGDRLVDLGPGQTLSARIVLALG